MRSRFVLLLLLLGAASSQEVTPVQKVITLLEDLKTEVEGEGKTEAGTYDTFACFCKDTTTTKADSITSGQDNIDTYSADIESKTASVKEKSDEIKTRQEDQEGWTKELQETEVRCQKAQADYEANAADLAKAISSLEKALNALASSKPASLLSVRESVKQGLLLADVLNLVSEPRRKAVDALLQTEVDPADPTYKFKSQGVIDTLSTLKTDFEGEKTELDAEWEKTKGSCKTTKETLAGQIQTNGAAMDTLKGDIESLKGEIATSRENLVNAEQLLKDDQTYLKDLTERCEARAKDWDQRSSMRADEVQALSGALALLKNNISSSDTEVNERALLLERHASIVAAGTRRASEPAAKARGEVLARVSQHTAGLSFLQLQQGTPAGAAGSAHAAAAAAAGGRGLLRGGGQGQPSRQEKAINLLDSEGKRLQSRVLSAVASKAAEDPFAKVKTLIQQLIERLLKEATEEATKKGFCDQEIGKATQDRDYRLSDVKKLDAEIQVLMSKKTELNESVVLLADDLVKLRNDLNESTVLRAQEKQENLAAIAGAKEGVAAVQQAIDILSVFYKKASMAAVQLRASPVDEDTTGAGFKGSYSGKGQAAHGIIGMLEVIKADFDRTARKTKDSEDKAHEEFVEFEQTSKADISGKETKKTLDEEEFEATKTKITQKTDDLETSQGLVDSALKTIEDLKPTCIDTAMSYAERVQKREDEIAALKQAVCLLDPEGVESDCPAS